jgi:HTH-type transcriptional regulator, glycine betaine synthesis regulator
MIGPTSGPKTVNGLSRTRLDMIEAGGRLCQLLGVPRSTGQIYGLLYLSARALSLDDIVEQLGISKASASTGTRQLIAWRAIRQVWVPGERRDHFEIEPDLGYLIRSTYRELIKPRLASSHKRMERISASLEEELNQGTVTRADYKVCSDRLKQFIRIQKKLRALAPLAEKLL